MRFLLLALLMLPIASRGATITAVSANRDDVATAITSAVTGDTVEIPAGTAYWVSAITFAGKGIHIKGAGTNETIIVDENPSRSSSTTIFAATWTNLTGMLRISHIQFLGGTTNTGVSSGGTISIYGANLLTNSSFWRIDHNYFNNPRTRGIYALAYCGLIDQNVFLRAESPGGPSAGIVLDGRTPNTNSKGHESYAEPVYWGSTNFIFLENNREYKSAIRGFTDGFTGARWVARYNQTTNGYIGNHGTESTGVYRGTRAMEVYGNVLHSTSGSQCATEWRSGTGLVFSNTISGSYPGIMRGVAYRLVDDDYVPWGPANGTNVWDLAATNTVPGDPWETGTHTGSNGATSLTDGSKSWTPGQWFGYTVQQESPLKWGLVSTNTATNISFESAVIATNTPTWNTGDAYKIWRVWQALDQPGTGLSDLLTGGGSGSPQSQATPTAWPNQAAEPIYIWDNTGSNSDTVFRYGTIREDEHFKFEAMPGYTTLTYPHPVADYQDSLGGDSFIPSRISGRSTIRGRATLR